MLRLWILDQFAARDGDEVVSRIAYRLVTLRRCFAFLRIVFGVARVTVPKTPVEFVHGVSGFIESVDEVVFYSILATVFRMGDVYVFGTHNVFDPLYCLPAVFLLFLETVLLFLDAVPSGRHALSYTVQVERVGVEAFDATA